MLLAEMYLLARKYGREDTADIYKARCCDKIYSERFTDEDLASVAVLCGSDSSRYVDTPLPAGAVDELCCLVEDMNGTERETVKKKLEEGSLLSNTLLRRFAVRVLDILPIAPSESSSSP